MGDFIISVFLIAHSAAGIKVLNPWNNLDIFHFMSINFLNRFSIWCLKCEIVFLPTALSTSVNIPPVCEFWNFYMYSKKAGCQHVAQLDAREEIYFLTWSCRKLCHCFSNPLPPLYINSQMLSGNRESQQLLRGSCSQFMEFSVLIG